MSVASKMNQIILLLALGLFAGCNFDVNSKGTIKKEDEETDSKAISDQLTVGFSKSQEEYTEGNKEILIYAELSEKSDEVVEVSYDFVPGINVDSQDYTGFKGTVFIMPGKTISSPIKLNLRDDQIAEESEYIDVRLMAVKGAVLGRNIYKIIIRDNDGQNNNNNNNGGNNTGGNTGGSPALPMASFEMPSSSGSESSQQHMAMVRLTQASDKDISVGYTVEAITATANQDFFAFNGSVVFMAGETSKPVNFFVINDTVQESAETFKISLNSANGAVIGGTTEHVFTIIDDDTMSPTDRPILTFANSASNFGEEAGVQMITARLNKVHDKTVMAQVEVSAGNASEGSDFQIANKMIIIPQGQTQASISIVLVDDTVYEGDETFTLSLSSNEAQVFSGTNHVVFIKENDAQPVPASVAFQSATSAGPENVMQHYISVVLDKVVASPVQVSYSVQGLTAMSGGDFIANAGVLTIPAGQTMAEISVLVIDDKLVEANDETLKITLLSASGAQLGAIKEHTHTIMDDDKAEAEISFASAMSNGPENANANIVISLKEPITEASSVQITTMDGTATAGEDYMNESVTVTIPAGATQVSYSLKLMDDEKNELAEDLTLKLSNPMKGKLGAITEHKFTIDASDSDKPVDNMEGFSRTLYSKVLRVNPTCKACHSSESAVAYPYQFADPNLAKAYNELVNNEKVNLFAPANSRIYTKIANDNHNCGGAAACAQLGGEILTQIQEWVKLSGVPVPAGNIESVRAKFDKIAADTRVKSDIVALWRFKEGTGMSAKDTSGVTPAADLALNPGVAWVDGGGVNCNANGNALTASAEGSRKFFDMITAKNAYSVEAWITPKNANNNTAGKPWRIVSYSLNTAARNFTLGQQDNGGSVRLRGRSSLTDGNGTPSLDSANGLVEDDKQYHIVATYDGERRRLYVNGQLINITEPRAGAQNLGNWANNHRIVLCNELDNSRTWNGEIKLAAVYAKALSLEEVNTNFQARFSEQKLAISLDLSAIVAPGAKLTMDAEIVDEKAYSFFNPKFENLPAQLPVKSMQIAINGEVKKAGQGWKYFEGMVNDDDIMTSIGSTVQSTKGLAEDEISVVFEEIGQIKKPITRAPASYENLNPNVANPAAINTYALKTIEEVNRTMSKLTGVAMSTEAVNDRFKEVSQSLPTTDDITTFSSSQQVAIYKLAESYCVALMANTQLRNATFPGIDWNNNNANAVFNAARTDSLARSIASKFLLVDLASTPDRTMVEDEIGNVIDSMKANAETTRVIGTGACIVGLGSLVTEIKE